MLYYVKKSLTDFIFSHHSCLDCGVSGIFDFYYCQRCLGLLDSELNSFYDSPIRCVFCSRPVRTVGYCRSCLSFHRNLADVALAAHYALSAFTPIIERSIYAAKFQGNYLSSYYWAKQLALVLPGYQKQGYQFVLAPSKNKRHLMSAIARYLHSISKIKIYQGLGKRKSIEQKSLSVESRLVAQRENIYVKRSFEKQVRGQNWLIIDDIYTTGATMIYSAQALKNNGANKVMSLSLSLAKFE